MSGSSVRIRRALQVDLTSQNHFEESLQLWVPIVLGLLDFDKVKPENGNVRFVALESEGLLNSIGSTPPEFTGLQMDPRFIENSRYIYDICPESFYSL
jgi:hypothetical protein